MSHEPLKQQFYFQDESLFETKNAVFFLGHMAKTLRQPTKRYILKRTKEELMIEIKENLGAKQKIAGNG